MLGKTNITTLSESAVVTEIEDYNWLQMQLDIYTDFVKAIYKNGYLAAITADGTIVYTEDGEAWQNRTLEYEDCRLNDIDWDGNRFILAGSYKGTRELSDGTSEEIRKGLILVTSDFTTYEKKDITNEGDHVLEYFLIYHKNGKYIVLADIIPNKYTESKAYVCAGTLKDKWELKNEVQTAVKFVSAAKNSKDIIAIYVEIRNGIMGSRFVWRISGDSASKNRYDGIEANAKSFECKDELYAMFFGSHYNLYKISNSDECMMISSEKNFAFVDGVYFNDCQLFINNHEMLIVKKGESIADKTLDDLIEIAPEFTMNCITKAFGQLYIFGNQGVILKSSVETGNEEVITVQAISAKKALSDAKRYTDERYDALEKRIAVLEGETSNE